MASNTQCWTRTAKSGSTYVHCEEVGFSSDSSQSSKNNPPVPRPLTAQDLENSKLMQMALQAEMRAESLRNGPMTPEKAMEIAKNNELLIKAFEAEMKNPINAPVPLRAEDIYDPPIEPVYPEAYLLPALQALKLYDQAKQWHAQGKEFKFGNNLRIAPFGNRTGNPYGELPHYHRSRIDPETGNPIPSQGANKHRPWEIKSGDKTFWDRF